MSHILELNNTITEANIPLDMLRCMFETTEESMKKGEIFTEKGEQSLRKISIISIHIIKSQEEKEKSVDLVKYWGK